MKKIIIMVLLATCLSQQTRAQMADNTREASGIEVSSKPKTGAVYALSTNPLLTVPDPAIKDREYYLRKSENARSAGWATLIAGVVISGFGLLIGTNRNASFSQAETGVYIMGIGALSGIVSIPLMITATVYKHKAKAMVSSQKTGFGVPANVSRDIVGITLQIPMGK